MYYFLCIYIDLGRKSLQVSLVAINKMMTMWIKGNITVDNNAAIFLPISEQMVARTTGVLLGFYQKRWRNNSQQIRKSKNVTEFHVERWQLIRLTKI